MYEYVLKVRNKLKFVESISLDNRSGFKFKLTSKDCFALTFSNMDIAYASMLLYNAICFARYRCDTVCVTKRTYSMGAYRFETLD